MYVCMYRGFVEHGDVVLKLSGDDLLSGMKTSVIVSRYY